MKGFPNFKTGLKPTLNKFCFRGSVCLFVANTLAAFMRQITSKYKYAIVVYFRDLVLLFLIFIHLKIGAVFELLK